MVLNVLQVSSIPLCCSDNLVCKVGRMGEDKSLDILWKTVGA